MLGRAGPIVSMRQAAVFGHIVWLSEQVCCGPRSTLSRISQVACCQGQSRHCGSAPGNTNTRRPASRCYRCMGNPLHPDRMTPAERTGRTLPHPCRRPDPDEGGEVQSFICRRWREFCRLLAPEERSCNATSSGDLHDDSRPHPGATGGAEDHADAAAEEAMARSVRDRAAALQPALSRKPAGLPHPGTGLWRAEA